MLRENVHPTQPNGENKNVNASKTITILMKPSNYYVPINIHFHMASPLTTRNLSSWLLYARWTQERCSQIRVGDRSGLTRQWRLMWLLPSVLPRLVPRLPTTQCFYTLPSTQCMHLAVPSIQCSQTSVHPVPPDNKSPSVPQHSNWGRIWYW